MQHLSQASVLSHTPDLTVWIYEVILSNSQVSLLAQGTLSSWYTLKSTYFIFCLPFASLFVPNCNPELSTRFMFPLAPAGLGRWLWWTPLNKIHISTTSSFPAILWGGHRTNVQGQRAASKQQDPYHLQQAENRVSRQRIPISSLSVRPVTFPKANPSAMEEKDYQSISLLSINQQRPLS